MNGKVIRSLELSNKRALIVDDDPVIRALLSFVLQKHSFIVLALGDARDALTILDTQSFDVLFTDLRLPGMNGQELAEETRLRFPQIPIVVMSAASQGEFEDLLQQVKFDHKLSKPFSLKDVENLLDKLMKKRGHASA